jgi:hypothetical protein
VPEKHVSLSGLFVFNCSIVGRVWCVFNTENSLFCLLFRYILLLVVPGKVENRNHAQPRVANSREPGGGTLCLLSTWHT